MTKQELLKLIDDTFEVLLDKPRQAGDKKGNS